MRAVVAVNAGGADVATAAAAVAIPFNNSQDKAATTILTNAA